jgi:hypothetical protein
LIAEHRGIAELEANIFNAPMVFDVESSILENNLFGVDINQESVEIAKLSLWLRTAKKGRKLNSLNNNIKCGNSLIDDPAVAGVKAFNWQNEFPHIFDKGGFDVVIGNPPYLRVQGIKENHNSQSLFFEEKYNSAKGRYDLYILFIEQGIKLINPKGKLSFILPHNFINGNLGESIRTHLTSNKYIEEILHFGSHKVFNDVSTYTCILTLSLNNQSVRYLEINPTNIFNELNFDTVDYSKLNTPNWSLNTLGNSLVLQKLKLSKYSLEYYFKNIARGVVTGHDAVFILKGKIKDNIFNGYSKELNKSIEIESKLLKPILMGGSVNRYIQPNNELYILYPHKIENNKTIPYSENELSEQFPKSFDYLLNFKNELKAKKVKYKTNPEYWYSLHNSREIQLFENKKIITPYLVNKGQMSIDYNSNFYTNDKCSVLILKEDFIQYYEYFLGLLNSSLLWFFIKNTGSEFAGGYFAYTNLFLSPFPMPKIPSNNKIFKNLVEIVLLKNKELQQANSQFQKLLSSKFENININTKLEKWYELSFADFNKELSKQKIKLSLSEQSEWLTFFEQEKQKALTIKNEIDRTDKEIDQMVYQLYGLTEEEIKIVEAV